MSIVRHKYYAERHGGKWRTARKAHRCDWGQVGARCHNQIHVGQKYFDTGTHNPQSSNQHATYRICTDCANETIEV